MKAELTLKQNQRMVMTPQLWQAIRLLQMNTVELSEALMDAYDSNPLLELEGMENGGEPLVEEVSPVMEFADGQWSSSNQDWMSHFSDSRQSQPGASGVSGEMPEHAVSVSLQEFLRNQLSLLVLDPWKKVLAEHVVLNLDEAGYLDADLENILAEARHHFEPDHVITLSDVETALFCVQSLDPVGVGARNPEECLLLQLPSVVDGGRRFEIARQVISSCLPLLAKRKLSAICEQLEVGPDELQQAIELIQQLNPHPGYSVGRMTENSITPDVLVEQIGGVWSARLHSSALPRIMINRDVRQMIVENSGKESFSRMKTHLQDADWLLENLNRRHETLLAVATQIINRQIPFLELGPVAMKPMTQREIADALDVHESTVSRAVNGKYMQTPHGTLEMSYFFSSEVGIRTSSIAVRELIRQVVESESPENPVTDRAIHKELIARGCRVARRTVAKYREQMNIPPSTERRPLVRVSGN